MSVMKEALVVGDAMIPKALFEPAVERHLSAFVERFTGDDWEPDWKRLQHRRLEVEKLGPDIEAVPEVVSQAPDAEMLLGLFVPVSSQLLAALPKLRIVGVCRAGLENVNLEDATRRDVLVFNVQGRNAQAVSDFTVGLMLAESRNITRAHASILRGEWRKKFSNSDSIPEMKGKCVGIVGFGYIGQLVARKLSGFDVEILVFDPYVDEAIIAEHGAEAVEKNALFERSDFVTVHARMSDATRGMIGSAELQRMKETAYLVNTARAGLIDYKALAAVLERGGIAGAAIDVFPEEPLPQDSRLRALDNVTLTTHIAGTTTEVLSNSPYLLAEDIERLLRGGTPRFLVNPQVLDRDACKAWLSAVRAHE